MDSGFIAAKRSAISSAILQFTHRIRDRRLASKRAAAAGRGARRGVLDPSKAVSGNRLAPVDVFARNRAVVPGGIVAVARQPEIRDANLFTYGAIIEVAALFVGIFICMQPACRFWRSRAANWGSLRRAAFLLGVRQLIERARQRADLSGVFQNGPVAACQGGRATVAGVDPLILAAISLGSVFMGAMTYIGNGPNFMVRSIAESSGVKNAELLWLHGLQLA